MKPRNTEAGRLEADYLSRLRATLADRNESETAEIVQAVREHIEEALAEFDGEQATLVEMAEVIEKLGPPETYADAEAARPPGAAPLEYEAELDGAPLIPAQQLNAYGSFLGKLWWAYLITVVGLFLPVVDFAFCALIGYAALAHVISTRKGDYPGEFDGTASLAGLLAVLVLVAAPLRLLNLAEPAWGLLTLPVAIAMFGLSLLVYWRVLGGVASLVEGASGGALAGAIRNTRTTYILLRVALFVITFVVGAVVATAIVGQGPVGSGQRIALAKNTSLAKLALLPVSWLLGWYFILRPIARAREALAGCVGRGARPVRTASERGAF